MLAMLPPPYYFLRRLPSGAGKEDYLPCQLCSLPYAPRYQNIINFFMDDTKCQFLKPDPVAFPYFSCSLYPIIPTEANTPRDVV